MNYNYISSAATFLFKDNLLVGIFLEADDVAKILFLNTNNIYLSIRINSNQIYNYRLLLRQLLVFK